MLSIAHWAGVLKKQSCQGAEKKEDFLSAGDVASACRLENHQWRERLWPPLATLWTFLMQVQEVGCSCREAVAMFLAGRAATGANADASADASAYCQARKRLPEGVIKRCMRLVAERLRDKIDPAHLWLGRRVWVVDGSSCSMPDTPELQAVFGQPSGQKPGCGFPVTTIVAMFSWATGAVPDVAIGSCRESELPLWRRLWHLLSSGDIVLGDRLYCTYSDLAGLLRRGCDGVFRLHQSRKPDFRRGKKLGRNDCLVRWKRPVCSLRQRGMSVEEWDRLPLEMSVRLIRANVGAPGFRCRNIVIATTLLDPVRYPVEEIIALYGDRWTVELRLRDIKTTLGMDVLRGKSADVVRKEIIMHLLVYNLIRSLMWEAAAAYGQPLHRLSFAGALQHINASLSYMWLYAGSLRARKLYQLLLSWIARDLLPHRPNRAEPRAVKRRPKQYALLNKPREEMRKALVS